MTVVQTAVIQNMVDIKWKVINKCCNQKTLTLTIDCKYPSLRKLGLGTFRLYWSFILKSKIPSSFVRSTVVCPFVTLQVLSERKNLETGLVAVDFINTRRNVMNDSAPRSSAGALFCVPVMNRWLVKKIKNALFYTQIFFLFISNHQQNYRKG